MYFELINDNLCDFELYSSNSRAPESIEFDYDHLTPAPERPLTFFSNATEATPPPDFWKDRIPIMSARFIRTLTIAGIDNIQTIPIVIKSHNGDRTWTNYCAAYIYGRIQCVNEEDSEYTEMPEGIYRFTKLVINPKVPRDALMFCCQENPRIIAVHLSIAKAIALADSDYKLTGWDLKAVSGYKEAT